jgi:flagellin
MVIQTNVMALNAYRQILQHSIDLAKSMEKLASGYRINSAADDAAGLAISEKLRSQITGMETATKNAWDGISLIQTAEGALTEVHSMLNRMTELATQSANGIYTEVERKALDDEFQQLKAEIDRVSKATNFNGINLLDGSLQIPLQIGDTADDYNILNVKVSDMSSKGLGIADMRIDTAEAASAAIGTTAQQGERGTIKGAINFVSSQRGTLGALQNRLNHTIKSLNVMVENLTDAESRIRDTDYAKEMMNYTRSSILLQAAQAMLAQANMIPQSILSLLR